MIEQEKMARICAKKLTQLDWILGEISSAKEFSGIGTGCPEKRGSVTIRGGI